MLQKNPGSMRRALRALVACAVAGLILGGGITSKAYAADDEDDAIDIKMLRSVMRGLGLKRGDEESIDYRERSPLVVPPSLELPPPEDPALAQRNPEWPDDPDIRKARQAVKRQKKIIEWSDESRALRPDELNRGIPRGDQLRIRRRPRRLKSHNGSSARKSSALKVGAACARCSALLRKKRPAPSPRNPSAPN